MKKQIEEKTVNKPVHETKFGACRVAIWKNESGFHSLTASRLYKDKDGNWRDSSSFDRDDIPQLIHALEAAYQWLYAPKAE